MLKTTLLSACIAAAASGAAAGPFDGIWRASPTDDCTRIGKEGGALEIEDNLFTGVESECRMTAPVNVRDMDAVLYDMECEGGGAEWTDRAMFMNAADGGLIMVWNGYAFKYAACDADAPAGTVTRSEDIGVTE